MVSIIVPVYNVEKYLRCCIDSILQQTYKDLEVILVDDGSTDHSLSICQEYESTDKRIVLIHQENKGLASARNAGIRRASGEYIYFVDSDDCINKCLIETLLDVAKKENATIVQTGFVSVESDFSDYGRNETVEKTVRYSAVEALTILERSKPGDEYILNLRTVVVWTKLYRKDAFDTLLFPEGMRLHEDQMVAHRNIIEAGGIVYVNAPLYYYRKAEGSLIRVGWTPKRLAMFDCYRDRVKWIRERLPEEKQLYQYVYKRYLVCIFRNYDMADKKLRGKERREVCRSIRSELREALKNRCKLSSGTVLFFKSLYVCPKVFCIVYRMRNSLLKK